MLDDGSYDALVIDATDPDAEGSFDVELTLTAGDHKGEVVAVTAAPSVYAGDPLDLLGIPATITVVDGNPTVRFEP